MASGSPASAVGPLQPPFQSPPSRRSDKTTLPSTLATPAAESRTAPRDIDQGSCPPSPSGYLSTWSSPRPAPAPPHVELGLAGHTNHTSEGALLSSQALLSFQEKVHLSNEKLWTYGLPGASTAPYSSAQSGGQASSNSTRSLDSRPDKGAALKMPIIQPRDESLGCLARQQRRREKAKLKSAERREKFNRDTARLPVPVTPTQQDNRGATLVADAFRSETTFRPTAPISTSSRPLRRPMLPAAYMHQTPARLPPANGYRPRGGSEDVARYQSPGGHGWEPSLSESTHAEESSSDRPNLPHRASSQQSRFRMSERRTEESEEGTAISPSSRRSQLYSDEQDDNSTSHASSDTSKQREIEVMFAAADHCRRRQGSRSALNDLMSPVVEQRESVDIGKSSQRPLHTFDALNDSQLGRTHMQSRSVDMLRDASDVQPAVQFLTDADGLPIHPLLQRRTSFQSPPILRRVNLETNAFDGKASRMLGTAVIPNNLDTRRNGAGGAVSSRFSRKKKTGWSRGMKGESDHILARNGDSVGKVTFSNPWALSPKEVIRAEAAAAAAAAAENNHQYRGANNDIFVTTGKDRWQNLWGITKGFASRPKISSASKGKLAGQDESDDDDELFGGPAYDRRRRESEQAFLTLPFNNLNVPHEAPLAHTRQSMDLYPDDEHEAHSTSQSPRKPVSRKAILSPALGSRDMYGTASLTSSHIAGQRYDYEPESPIVPEIWQGVVITPQASPAGNSAELFETLDVYRSQRRVDEEDMKVDASPPGRNADALKPVHLNSAKLKRSPEVQRVISEGPTSAEEEDSEQDFFFDTGSALEDDSTQPGNQCEDGNTVDLASLLAAHKIKCGRETGCLSVETPRVNSPHLPAHVCHHHTLDEPSFLECFGASGDASDEEDGDITATKQNSKAVHVQRSEQSWSPHSSAFSETVSNPKILSVGSFIRYSEDDAIIEHKERAHQGEDDTRSWEGEVVFRPSPNPSQSKRSPFQGFHFDSEEDGEGQRVQQSLSSMEHPYSFNAPSSPQSGLASADRFRFPRPPSETPLNVARVIESRQILKKENAPLELQKRINRRSGEAGDYADDTIQNHRRSEHISNPSVSSLSSDATNISHFGFPSLLGSESSREAAKRFSSSSPLPFKRSSTSSPSALSGAGAAGTGKRLSNSYSNGPSWMSPTRGGSVVTANVTRVNEFVRDRTILSPTASGILEIGTTSSPSSAYGRHRPTISTDSSSSQATGRTDYSSAFLHGEVLQRQQRNDLTAKVQENDKDGGEGSEMGGKVSDSRHCLTGMNDGEVGRRRLKSSIDYLEKVGMSRIDESDINLNSGFTGLGLTSSFDRGSGPKRATGHEGEDEDGWDGGE